MSLYSKRVQSNALGVNPEAGSQENHNAPGTAGKMPAVPGVWGQGSLVYLANASL